ncbi:hypothetical protein C4J81_13265 [Deltaproteobacteria bacterium Smac51]|nr:hypothetical protein C4J81_13265 [Deltaproteobacteria bacterium Smac51]
MAQKLYYTQQNATSAFNSGFSHGFLYGQDNLIEYQLYTSGASLYDSFNYRLGYYYGSLCYEYSSSESNAIGMRPETLSDLILSLSDGSGKPCDINTEFENRVCTLIWDFDTYPYPKGEPPQNPLAQFRYNKWYISYSINPELSSLLAGLMAAPVDPLALDLDGDGIETVSSDKGIVFDHDGDGLINDGSELFGEYTPKYDDLEDLPGMSVGISQKSNTCLIILSDKAT